MPCVREKECVNVCIYECAVCIFESVCVCGYVCVYEYVSVSECEYGRLCKRTLGKGVKVFPVFSP